MKYSITLTAFMALISIFVSGQNVDIINVEKYRKSSLIRHLNGLKPDNKPDQRGLIFPRNSNIVQGLKSSQTIKQRLDSTKYQSWNDTPKLWTDYSKRVNTYDANGNNTQSIGYAWAKASDTWIPDWKSEINYNGSNSVSQYLTYDWDKATSQWIPDWKDVFSYNSDGTMPQILQHDWDIKTNEWVLLWQSLYSYNTNGDLTLILDYYRDESTDLWVLALKNIYSFNTKRQQTQQLEYFLDEKTSEWVADSKIEYMYDENGNMSEYLVYNRNQTTDQLELDWKRDYTYENNYSFNDLISPFLYLYQVNYYHHKMTGQSTSMWNKSTSAWNHPIYNATYYYSELNTTSVNSLELKLAEIYPNPASEHINFHFTGIDNQAKFEMFDLQGRKVLSENVLNGGKLDVRQLIKGFYFYYIFTTENQQSGKLIIH